MAITGDKRVVLGQPVQMNCSFASVPAPTFVWKFNGTVLVEETKQCIQIQNFENQRSGIYTCEAFNSVTGLRKTATHNLMVKGKDRARIRFVVIHKHMNQNTSSSSAAIRISFVKRRIFS